MLGFFVFQFVSIDSLLFIGYYWEESGSIFFISSHQVVIHFDEITLSLAFSSLLFSWLNNSSCQSSLIWEMLQSINHICSPSLDLLLYINVFHIQGSPEMETALHVCPPQHRVKGKDHFPQFATLFLVQPRRLLAAFAARAHCWFVFNLMSFSTPVSLSTKLLSNQLAPSMYRCMGLFFPSCRISCFHLLKFIRFLFAHFFSPSNSLWMAAQSWINHTFQFCTSCRFAEGK